ncbi:hypothetical protein BU24DRAFT_201643 [Aaosphaeria arxii CBS 175.79]|uniref:Uncharacterized protein n=1 Tax=Aaosphaeria arxii CBS 175.79 TaxID=1450172 RepID=A0A6A5XSY6_9PLEO|nr:uncharacterized protein BU24DRAFT_201643 [Aaosphaeria arxii CBS 175.79]KAF2016435.1 hypothetical protein BU24DRAFT_201643 [Aaosphaeria arxii CBS 175.79]
MFSPHRIYVSFFGAAAWSFVAADTVFVLHDAVTLSKSGLSFSGLPIAASALNITALCSITVFAVQYVWKKGGFVGLSTILRRTLAGSCFFLCLLAMSISLASMTLIKTKKEEVDNVTSKHSIPSWTGLFPAHITIWALACVSQAVFFSSPLWTSSQPEPIRTIVQSGPRDSVMSEMRDSHPTTNLFMLEATQPSSPLATLPSPTFSTRSSQSLRSFRDSLHQVVRPVTSRSKLIRPSSQRENGSLYSDGHSISNISQSDGFDTWDTSSIDPQTRDAFVQCVAPSRGTALETIPGSRPASPAHALDGPFLLTSHEDDDGPLSPPPKLIPDLARPPSPAVSEAHIHPLFRSESPTPPPAATPGTQIMASPLSTQMIACPPRPYSRMRSNSSRAASPGPRASTRSLRDRAVSPQSSQRSLSPPSREMTPPIPEFVLNCTPRTSTSGWSERRRVS